jgi:hypothetical protein
MLFYFCTFNKELFITGFLAQLFLSFFQKKKEKKRKTSFLALLNVLKEKKEVAIFVCLFIYLQPFWTH